MVKNQQTLPIDVDQAFRLLLTRPPHPDESKILTRGYNQRLDHYRANPSAAKQLINEAIARAQQA